MKQKYQAAPTRTTSCEKVSHWVKGGGEKGNAGSEDWLHFACHTKKKAHISMRKKKNIRRLVKGKKTHGASFLAGYQLQGAEGR